MLDVILMVQFTALHAKETLSLREGQYFFKEVFSFISDIISVKHLDNEKVDGGGEVFVSNIEIYPHKFNHKGGFFLFFNLL